LIHANPNPDTTKVEPLPATSDEQAKLVSSVLDHKRFQACLEDWNEKVADFRRFCLILNERDNKFVTQDALLPKKKRGKTKGSAPTTSLLASHQDQPTSFFCKSLDDRGDAEENTDMLAYGPAAAMDEADFQKPKNRRGHRARKAKALAVQAKQEGRQYQSLNWREEKQRTKESKEESSKNKKKQRDKAATMGGDDKPQSAETKPAAQEDPASQHPSWAAKQQQKTGIVAFQGKKITFD
jgi:hypothetical protein